MKLIIDANVFKALLEKGSCAATTDSAKNDISEFGPIRRSARITATLEELSVESIGQDMSAKSLIKVIPGSGIEIKQAGSVVVLAKELIDWVGRQKSSKISLAFSPKEGSAEDQDDDSNTGEKFQLEIIGQLKMGARDDANTGNKWALDVFKNKLMGYFQHQEGVKPVFSISAKKIYETLTGSLFAVGSENNGVTDRFSFQKSQNKIYVAATDSRCCVLTDLTEEVKEFQLEQDQILLHAKNLIFVLKKFDDNLITLFNNEDRVSIQNIDKTHFVNMTLGDVKKFKSFPLVANYFSQTQYPVSYSFSKKTFLDRMENIKVVNSMAAIFVIENDKLFIHGVSEIGKQPAVATLPISLNGTPSLQRYVWGVQHVINGAKSCNGDSVKISISQDNNSFKMSGLDDDKFSIYGMRINNEKYNKINLG